MGTEPMDKGVGKGKKGFTTSGLQPNQPLVEKVQPGVPSVLGQNRYNKGTNQKEESFMESIGRKIAFYRKAKGLTQEELSEKLGVSPQAVSIAAWALQKSKREIGLSKEDLQRAAQQIRACKKNRKKIDLVEVVTAQGEKVTVRL